MREGTGKNGAYRGWGCLLPMRQKAEQCKAIWMMLGKDGNKPLTEGELEFKEMVESAGVKYWVVRNVTDALEMIGK